MQPLLLMNYSIYTIKHSDDLARVYSGKRKGSFEEYTNWKTGKVLLLEAREKSLWLTVLFAHAEKTDKIQYWARLTDIQIVQKPDGMFITTYSFEKLTKLTRPRFKKDLVLKSTKRPIHPDFIRPYALCLTPNYLNE